MESIGLSLANLLLPCQLRDSIPSQPILYKPNPEWVAVAQHCKEILYHRNTKIVEKYDKYTHNLPPLQAGDSVAIQSPLNHRWNTMGKIITALPDCQYQIRVDGSGRITLRNCYFFRKCKLKPAPTSVPSATQAMLYSCTAIPQHLPVMAQTEQLNPPNKPHIYHHAFDCQEFLELCPGYYHITGLA